MVLLEAVERDDLVDAVDELRAEEVLDRPDADGLDLGVGGVLIQVRELLRGNAEADDGVLGYVVDFLGADVARHHDEAVVEVQVDAAPRLQLASLEDLKQQIVQGPVGLLQLFEYDDGELLLQLLLGQERRLLVTDVAGRGAHELGHVVRILELRAVDRDDLAVVAVNDLCQ